MKQPEYTEGTISVHEPFGVRQPWLTSRISHTYPAQKHNNELKTKLSLKV